MTSSKRRSPLVMMMKPRLRLRSRLDAESLVTARHSVRHSFHRLVEVLVARVDVEPFPQDIVRSQVLELLDDRRLMLVFRADEHAVPLPSSRLGWLDQDHHLPTKEIRRKPAEHPLREEARVILERVKDPFVVERFDHGA